MAKIILKQKAIDDLSDIWDYTKANWSENQADYYYKAIQLTCKEISENPTIGKSYENVSENLLGYKSGKHIIFYHQISVDIVEIVRILHERMDLDSRIKE